MLSRADVGSLFGYARSYFHVDCRWSAPQSRCCDRSCPQPIDELYTVLAAPSRERRSDISRCSGI